VAYLLHRRRSEYAGARSIERAVAQNDAFGLRRARDALLQIPHRCDGSAKFRRRSIIQFIRFGFDGTVSPRESPATEALGDKALDARLPRRSQQIVGSLRPQPVAVCERTIEMPEVGDIGEIGHFMNDDFRSGRNDCRANGRRVEAIGHDRFRTHLLYRFGLRGGTREADDRMTCGNQRRNEGMTHGAGGACNKNSHGESSCLSQLPRQIIQPNMDSSAGKAM